MSARTDRAGHREAKGVMQLTVELDIRVMRHIDRLARAYKRTKAEIVREALIDYIRFKGQVRREPVGAKEFDD